MISNIKLFEKLWRTFARETREILNKPELFSRVYFQLSLDTLKLDKWSAYTVCSCHVTYAFESESTLYSCLNVKELLARSRHEIWRWGDCNWTRAQNHLVLKRTLNHLAKLYFNDYLFYSWWKTLAAPNNHQEDLVKKILKCE